MPYTYMLRCADGSYYVGSTWQLERRLDQHQSGNGAEYTKRRRPVELVYAAEFDRVEDAFAWEKRLQNWSRAKREALIRGDFGALPHLSSRRGGKPARETR
ncbi:GIY-YIG nuclease family protein [Amnibacterium endophyticum]|uniref:GIY-YIG nuclease family protein n=1 Tax=Amnibacterium endophyticum TaxID=2109337 RepID=A0ABW4LJ79_9MICO